MQAEAEIWRRKDGKSFHEDVGYGFVASEMRVELVSDSRRSVSPINLYMCDSHLIKGMEDRSYQIELIKSLHRAGVIHAPLPFR